MKKLILVFLASTTFAVLPPLAQNTRELQAILADPRLYESLGGAELIRELIRTEEGYLILTQNYAMQVEVIYEGRGDQKWVGPAQFHLEFHRPVALRGSF